MRRNLHVVFPAHVGMNQCVVLERWLQNRFPRESGVGSSKHQNRETRWAPDGCPLFYPLTLLLVYTVVAPRKLTPVLGPLMGLKQFVSLLRKQLVHTLRIDCLKDCKYFFPGRFAGVDI